MKKHNAKSGFTLIELLIAILIFSIIVTVIYSTFSTGTAAWKKTKTATDASMNMNSILEDLGRALRNSVLYKGLDTIGEADKFYFCSLADTISEDKEYAEVYRLGYYVEASAEDSSKFDLFYKNLPLSGGGFDIDEAKGRKLIGLLDEFKIEYAYKGGEEGRLSWRESWQDSNSMPPIIRIGVKKGNIKFTKYIWVPAGRPAEYQEQ